MESLRLPAFSFPVTTMLLFVVMVGRYFLLSGALYMFCKKSTLPPIELTSVAIEQIKRDISWSLLSSMIFALSGAVVVKLWQSGLTQIYVNLEQFSFLYLPLSLTIFLFLHDSYFYWTHRLLHKVNFSNWHSVHHESRIPTAWTSFSFHPVEALIQSLILPLLLVAVPIHWIVLFMFLAIMSVCGVTNHLGYELYPQFLEKRIGLITASHHQLHHGKVKFNFGLYFTWWDKWMGTEYEERHG